MAQLHALVANTFEQGFLFAFLGLGVLITFRFFRFPDLTAEGSYTLGGAVVSTLLVDGVHPAVAIAAAVVAGMTAGTVTALIHTKLRVNNIISGIIVMTALYTVNLRVMGRANVSLLSVATLYDRVSTSLASHGVLMPDYLLSILLNFLMLTIVGILLARFMASDVGLAVRATGENEPMGQSLGVNTDITKMIGLALSNGAVALSGALVAQDNGFADIGMGTGVLVTGAAAVMIGEAVFGDRTIPRWIVATILGVLAYRFLVAVALRVGLSPVDLKLITAVLLLASLTLPRFRNLMVKG